MPRDASLSENYMHYFSERERFFHKREQCNIHTEKSFRDHDNPNQIWIVITIFRLNYFFTWLGRTASQYTDFPLPLPQLAAEGFLSVQVLPERESTRVPGNRSARAANASCTPLPIMFMPAIGYSYYFFNLLKIPKYNYGISYVFSPDNWRFSPIASPVVAVKRMWTFPLTGCSGSIFERRA